MIARRPFVVRCDVNMSPENNIYEAVFRSLCIAPSIDAPVRGNDGVGNAENTVGERLPAFIWMNIFLDYKST